MYDVRTGMHTFAGKQYGAVYIFGRAKVRRREKGNERSSAKKKVHRFTRTFFTHKYALLSISILGG